MKTKINSNTHALWSDGSTINWLKSKDQSLYHLCFSQIFIFCKTKCVKWSLSGTSKWTLWWFTYFTNLFLLKFLFLVNFLPIKAKFKDWYWTKFGMITKLTLKRLLLTLTNLMLKFCSKNIFIPLWQPKCSWVDCQESFPFLSPSIFSNTPCNLWSSLGFFCKYRTVSYT